MLHILWLVIKCILILLGILLGLILLAFLAILFVPVRYRAGGEKGDGGIRAKVNVSWLFHGISFWLWYEDNKVRQEVKIFGVSVNRVRDWLERRRSAKGAKASGDEQQAVKKDLPDGRTAGQKAKEQAMDELPLTPPKGKPAEEVPRETLPEKIRMDGSSESDVAPPLLESRPAEPPGRLAGIFKRLGYGLRKGYEGVTALFRRIVQLFKKVLGIPRKILERLKKISLTIHGIYDKISYWRDFLQDERTKAALHLCWSQLKHLLKHMAPTKISGHVKFGMGDPCITGEILAGLGMTYPIHKNRIQVMPVFDEKIFLGEVQCKGRIYGVVLAIAAWKIYFDKNIKYMIKRWNHKEG